MNLLKTLHILIAITGIALFTGACTGKSSSTGNNGEEIITINHFITQWHADAAASDHEAYIGAMTGQGIYIGTDATEYWKKDAFSAWSKPYFDKKQGWNLKKINRNIYLSEGGETAWFDELLDTGMGLCRGSGVLVKTNGEWKIAHYVLSVTLPNDLIPAVRQLKHTTDSTLIVRMKHGKRQR